MTNLSDKRINPYDNRQVKNMLYVKDVKEFIQHRESRLRNQIRIHWKWLKSATEEVVTEFIVNVANSGAGPELTGQKLGGGA